MTLVALVLTQLGWADEPEVNIELGAALTEAKKPVWEAKGAALDLFLQADTAFRGKSWVAAANGMIDVMEAQPGCGKAAYKLAWALSEKDEHEDAGTVVDATFAWFPESKDVLLRGAQIHVRGKSAKQAAVMTDVLRARWPADYLGWTWAIRSAQSVRDLPAATAVLEDARTKVAVAADVACFSVMVAALSGDAALGTKEWTACQESETTGLRRLAEGNLALTTGDWLTVQKYAVDLDAPKLVRLALVLQRLEEGNSKGAMVLVDKLAEEDASAFDVAVVRARAHHAAGDKDGTLAALSAIFAPDWNQNWAGRDTLVWSRGPGWLTEHWVEAVKLNYEVLTAAGRVEDAKKVMALAMTTWPDAGLKP